MRITVEYLAQLRVAAGTSRAEVECPDGSTVTVLVAQLADTHGEAFRSLALDEEGAVRRTLLVAAGGRRVAGSDPLREGDVLILGTPIAGG